MQHAYLPYTSPIWQFPHTAQLIERAVAKLQIGVRYYVLKDTEALQGATLELPSSSRFRVFCRAQGDL